MIEIDPASPVPLYRQIAEQIQRQIALGALRTGERLPAVRELAVVARVNRNTAARAVQYLESVGLVRTRVGQGTFVEERRRPGDGHRSTAALESLIDRLVVEGHTLGLTAEELGERIERRSAEFRRTREDRAVNRPEDGEEPA